MFLINVLHSYKNNRIYTKVVGASGIGLDPLKQGPYP